MTAPRRRHRAKDTSTDQTVKSTGVSASERQQAKSAPQRGVQLTDSAQGDGLIVARVSVRDGATINMGNYNSFRRDVGLEMDIVLDGENTLDESELSPEAEKVIDDTYDAMAKWVAKQIDGAFADARDMFED